MEKEPDYLVRHPKKIVDHLTELVNKKCIISAHFGEDNQGFLTVIIDINQKNNELRLDCAPTELLNQQLLSAGQVLFRTEIDGVAVSFTGNEIKRLQSGEHTVLAMPMPDSIFWRQRRDYYRVKIPQSHTGSYCQITFKTKEAFSETRDFKILDIGVCGFAILNPDLSIQHCLTSNVDPMPCTLYLQDNHYASVGFSVKDSVEIRASATTTQQRIGCFFTEISPAFESKILRYMQDIERMQKNIG